MSTATATPTEVTATDVRYWAKARGIAVGSRGRIPADVIEAFNKAHRTKEYRPAYFEQPF